MFYAIAGKLSMHPDYIIDILNTKLNLEDGYNIILKLDKYTIENKCRGYDKTLVEKLKISDVN
jgi:hypothetical protein